ncbi:MAG: DNA/RNA nuclease SfsA [Pyrobaculum sp.]
MSFPLPPPDVAGRFVRRVNRFLGLAEISGGVVEIHIHDPGRLAEVLTPGVMIWARERGKGRARYYLLAAEVGGELVLVDSALHTKIARWLIESGHVFHGYRVEKTEPAFGGGRFDLLLRTPTGGLAYVEVKGVTLESGGRALFPDAPTSRGARHMLKLVEAARLGHEAWVLFLVFRKRAEVFSPNWGTDRRFSQALTYAYRSGVGVVAAKLDVFKWGVGFVKTLPIELGPLANM